MNEMVKLTEWEKVKEQLSADAKRRVEIKTPKEEIKRREGRKGRTGKPMIFDYVEDAYMMALLNNEVPGWSFEVIEMKEIYNSCIVHARLRFIDGGIPRVIDDVGRQEIKLRKDPKTGLPYDPIKPLDIGNDMKGAVSDAFKRCCARFGFAADVYRNEAKLLAEAEDIEKDIEEEQETGIVNIPEKEKPTLKEKPVTKNFQFLEAMRIVKEGLQEKFGKDTGEAIYYLVLAEPNKEAGYYGYAKSKYIVERSEQTYIYKRLKQIVEGEEEPPEEAFKEVGKATVQDMPEADSLWSS